MKKRELGPVVAIERARGKNYFYRLGLNRRGELVWRKVPQYGPLRYASEWDEAKRSKLYHLGIFACARGDGAPVWRLGPLRDAGLLANQPEHILNAIVARLLLGDT